MKKVSIFINKTKTLAVVEARGARSLNKHGVLLSFGFDGTDKCNEVWRMLRHSYNIPCITTREVHHSSKTDVIAEASTPCVWVPFMDKYDRFWIEDDASYWEKYGCEDYEQMIGE